MSLVLLGVLLFAVTASAVLTGVVRAYAMKSGMIDRPNPRSSHTVATPRGGGAAIVAVTAIGFVVLAAMGVASKELVGALLAGGVAIAVIGLIDDRKSVPASIRAAVHVVAAALTVYLIGRSLHLQVGEAVLQLRWVGLLLSVVAIVWAINLFNFMDGIDGIAASEATFVAGAGAVLTWMNAGNAGQALAATMLAGASLGFLFWNWQPAKIFMGDVGSGYVGFVIGTLALASAQDNPVGPFVWIILGGTFLTDATVTLLRRLARRERVFEPHRLHAYQRLSQRWSSHQLATMSFVTVNVVWLFPLAWYANTHRERAACAAIVAIVPMVLLALAAGAGRRNATH